MLPARAQSNQGAANFHLRDFGIRSGDYRGGFAFGQLQQLAVANQVGHAEARQPSLPRAEELSRSAQLKIEFGDLETVVGADHGFESTFALFCYFATSHQDAVRLRRSATNAPAQL